MGDGERVAPPALITSSDFTPTASPTHYDFSTSRPRSQSFELEGEALLTVDDISIPHVATRRSFEL